MSPLPTLYRTKLKLVIRLSNGTQVYRIGMPSIKIYSWAYFVVSADYRAERVFGDKDFREIIRYAEQF